MKMRVLLVPLVLALFSYDISSRANAQSASCEPQIAHAARRYDIPLAVFYAVGLNETGVAGRLKPYAMNIDGRPSVASSLPEALARFRGAKAAGARMIDLGCMQINHHYHAARFASLEAMFDPATNVDYAARFLRDLKMREKTWTMAVARYNAGPNNDPAQKKYVCGVLVRMVASGFGAWTESARKFCFSTSVAISSKAVSASRGAQLASSAGSATVVRDEDDAVPSARNGNQAKIKQAIQDLN